MKRSSYQKYLPRARKKAEFMVSGVRESPAKQSQKTGASRKHTDKERQCDRGSPQVQRTSRKCQKPREAVQGQPGGRDESPRKTGTCGAISHPDVVPAPRGSLWVMCSNWKNKAHYPFPLRSGPSSLFLVATGVTLSGVTATDHCFSTNCM